MLTSLRVANYRALRDLRIDELNRINLISGQNNSGKTTLLESLLMLSAGHPDITLHRFIVRGMKSENLPRDAIPSVYWKQIFPSFDLRKEIQITAEHGTIGRLSLNLRMEHDDLVSRSIGMSNDLPLDDRFEESTLSATVRRGDQEWQRRIRVMDQAIETERRIKPPLFPAFVVPSGSGDLMSDATCLENLKKLKLGHRAVEALRIVEPALESLEVVSATGTPMIWADIGFRELVPLPAVGEGMVRISRLAMCMVLARGGVLLVDEVENGIHHSVVAEVWRFILRTAQELDVQVFATTHSYECVQAAQSLNSDELMLHRIEATDTGSRGVTYHSEHVETAVRHGLEVR